MIDEHAEYNYVIFRLLSFYRFFPDSKNDRQPISISLQLKRTVQISLRSIEKGKSF